MALSQAPRGSCVLSKEVLRQVAYMLFLFLLLKCSIVIQMTVRQLRAKTTMGKI